MIKLYRYEDQKIAAKNVNRLTEDLRTAQMALASPQVTPRDVAKTIKLKTELMWEEAKEKFAPDAVKFYYN